VSKHIPIMEEWLENAKREADQKRCDKMASRTKGQKCKNCVHYLAHTFSPKYHYCSIGRSPHTPNGLAKTSPTKWCVNWEEKK